MKSSRKRDLKLVAFAMLIGLVLGVWAMRSSPQFRTGIAFIAAHAYAH